MKNPVAILRKSFGWGIQSPLSWALGSLLFLLIAIETARPCFFLHDDNATWFIGAYVHDFRVLTETGRLAEVNYYQYGGEPFLEQGQTAVLYPPVYLGVALAKWVSGDWRWSLEWIAAGHLALGLLGFYFWLRQGGVTRGHAAWGGLAWALNPFVLIVASSWIMVSYVVAWLPWLFWALDRLFIRPTHSAALMLGIIMALFFLQGYVQWVCYAVLFLSFHALLRSVARVKMHRLSISYYLIVSALVFFALTAPLLLPMIHAMDASLARSKPLAVLRALDYPVLKADLVQAQLFHFRPNMVFGISSVMLFCPALVLFPLTLLWFLWAGTAIRQRLFPLLVLALLALFFASRWHVLLTFLPVFDRFRWPYKVFIFAEFFLLAALVWSASSWAAGRASSRVRSGWAAALLALVVLLDLTVALTHSDGNHFSKTTLPTSDNPLPPGMDPRLGRVIAMDTILPEAASYRFFTHGHGTYFAVPSLGGYNPLVGVAQLRFALGLDFPNIFSDPITPAVRRKLEARSVRYWIVDPRSPQAAEVEALPGLRLLASEKDRLIFADPQAAPLAYAAAAPAKPCLLTYAGNSILISLDGVVAPVEVSVGPTDGWWYRIDRGPWRRAVDENDRLKIDFPASGRLLEISYFDPRFREGLRLSLTLLVFLGLLWGAGRFFRQRQSDRTNG